MDQIGGLQVVDYYGAAEAHAYMTEHMNRYYGFNVMPELADSPDNWKEASSKVQYYCDSTDDPQGYAMKCANVGAIMYGEFPSAQFQLPFSDRGLVMSDGSSSKVPGPWMDTIRPPQVTQSESIRAAMVVPATPAPEMAIQSYSLGTVSVTTKSRCLKPPQRWLAKVSQPCLSIGFRKASGNFLVNPA